MALPSDIIEYGEFVGPYRARVIRQCVIMGSQIPDARRFRPEHAAGLAEGPAQAGKYRKGADAVFMVFQS